MSNMRVGAAVAVLLCVAALGVPSASAQECEVPCFSVMDWWPLEFRAHYNETSEVLTLGWQPPEGIEAEDVEEYVVYKDGVEVARPTTQTWEESLAAWDDEYHSYEVTAVVDGTEGDKTLPIVVSKVRPPGWPNPNCSMIGIVTTLSPPGVYPAIHWQCFPL